jgi:hypothetical protein
MDETVESLLESFEKPPNTGNLGQLSELCEAMVAQATVVETMEAELALEKKKLQELRVAKIPALMLELGLGKLTIANGAEISIKRNVSCKFVAEHRNEALDWLDNHGFSDIVRREVGISFNRGEEDRAAKAATILLDAGFTPQIVKEVHHATLAAWGRRQVTENAQVPANLFDLNYFDIAEVKHGKK